MSTNIINGNVFGNINLHYRNPDRVLLTQLDFCAVRINFAETCQDMSIEYPGKFWKDYELVDSGDGEKLERFGEYYMIRPEPKALWGKTLMASQ